jgi:putative MATE family efflux protein
MKTDVRSFVQNPRRALFTLAWPITLGMLVQVMYNIVDTAYVGRLGPDALAALTFSFPIYFMMVAVNIGFNVGVNSLISRLIGAGHKRKAANAAMHALYVSLAVSVAFTLLGLLFVRPMFVLFGASGNVLSLGVTYMSIILAGSTCLFVSWTLGTIFSSQGDTKTATKIQVIGLVANTILEPIFIFGLGLGVAGAAIATIIAFAIGLGLGVYYLFVRKRTMIPCGLASFHYSPAMVREMFRVGLPAAAMQLMLSVYVVFINRFMVHFGTTYVAAFGLGTRMEGFAMLPFMGISIAMITLVGMFMGAKRYDLLRNFIWYSIRISVILACLMGIVFFVFPEWIFRVFTPDAQLIQVASAYMRVDVLTFPLMALGFGVARALQGMGEGVPGFVVTALRVLVVFVPVAYVFVYVLGYGYLSVVWAMVFAGVLANIVGVVWLQRRLARLPKALS